MIVLISLLKIYFQQNSVLAQNGLDNTKKEVLNKILKDKNTYRSIEKNDTSIICSMYIDNNFYSKDMRLFKNDTCYKFISVTEVIHYNIEKEVLLKLFGLPIIDHTWTYKKDNIYRIITLEIMDDFSVTTMISYNNISEYNNTIHFILNPTEYE